MSEQDRAVPAGAPEEGGELSLEREKVQIERERLALERERLAAERDKWKIDQVLRERAAGRVSMGISTLALALLVALLVGGTVGAWIVSDRERRAQGAMAESLLSAFRGDTNAVGRVLGNAGGRRGGYLLILD